MTEIALAALVLLILVALVVLRPVVTGEDDGDGGSVEDDGRRAALEAAKEARYREIRDAELDHRMGKLSDADHRAVDRDLRAQAIEILRQLDELEGREPDAERR